MLSSDLFSYLTAFTVAVILLWFLPRVAYRIGLLDHPTERKDHGESIPLIGGLAMFMAFTFAILTLAAPISHLRILFAGAFLLVTVGVLDDMHELSSSVRFLTQIVAALLMALIGGVALDDFGYISWYGNFVELGGWSIPLTVFATVGVINALNMSDGVDGLAGSLSLIATLALAVVAGVAGDFDSVRVLLLLAVVIVAFLLFNLRLPGRPRALVFMGDAGSMFLGFVLAWFVIKLSQGDDRAMAPVTALWFLAIPLIDTVSIMLRRILKGRSPFEADREHFHHILLLARFGSKQAVGIIAALAVLCAAVGLGGLYLGVSEAALFFGFLGLFTLYFLAMMRAWKVRRFINRSISRRKRGDRRSRFDRRQTVDREAWDGAERRDATEERRSGIERRKK